MHISCVIIVALFCIGYATPVVNSQTEYCSGEVFQPNCEADEVIIMQSARYGRMQLGRCIKKDLGYIGCSSDVMNQFDHECSGKPSCRVMSTERHIAVQGGSYCEVGLIRYLEATYICKKALALPNTCTSGRAINVEVATKEVYLSSETMHESCITHGKSWTISAQQGQQLNISLIDLQQDSHDSSVIYGSIKDPSTNKRAVFGSGPRQQYLLSSTSGSVDIVTQSTGQTAPRFLLHVLVTGCPNMSPPDGAWMTRHGDVMEIGCHSGAKSWTLTCQNNEWQGVVGYCGSRTGTKKDQRNEKTENTPLSISLNALVFGVSSFIILVSAVIFLIGVLVLKRAHHLHQQTKSNTRMGTSKANQLMSTSHKNHGTGGGLVYRPTILPYKSAETGEGGYKSLQMPFLGPKNARDIMTGDSGLPPAYTTYANSGASEGGESVKYYVLEDIAGRVGQL